MSDILFIAWMISGAILGVVFSILGKNTTFGTITGFLVAPAIPLIVLYILVVAVAEHIYSKRD